MTKWIALDDNGNRIGDTYETRDAAAGACQDAAREAGSDGDGYEVKALTLDLSIAAQQNVEETGIDPQDDIDAVRAGRLTRESLLAECLDGADADRVQGWNDYVDAVMAAASGTND